MLPDNISDNIIFYCEDNEKIKNLIKIAEDLACNGFDVLYIRKEKFLKFPSIANFKLDIYRRIQFCYIPTLELLLYYLKDLYKFRKLPNVVIIESLNIYYHFSSNLSVLLKFFAVLHNLINYLACKTNFECKSVINIDKNNFETMYLDKLENLFYFKKNCIFEIENENKNI